MRRPPHGRALLLAGVALLSGTTARAAAQSPGAAQDAAALRERLDPAIRDTVQAIIDSGSAAGLPAHPLAAKALEGAAKRAPGHRIVTAVRSLAADLGVARDQLGPAADEASLVAAVGALRTGVAPGYLAELHGARSDALAWPLWILADLVRQGVPADTAASVVLSLARAGASDAAFSAFQQQVARDVGAGVPPGAAAVARAPASGIRAPVQPPVGERASRSLPHPRTTAPAPARRP